jgi:hypothetical protein
MFDQFLYDFNREIQRLIAEPNILRSLTVVTIAIIAAYWGSRFVARAIVRIAQIVAVRADNTTNEERSIQLRRVETYLSILTALVRAMIIALATYYAWKALSPSDNSVAYALGASAFFVVIAGATIGMVMRDMTAGAVMIIERWFHVGDYIRIEPFGDVSGVVERVTLRSTKLRSLNGEVIWLHNQHVMAVKVTPRGLRTIAVDIFVNNKKVGQSLIEKALATMPLGTIKVAKKPEITRTEEWGDHLWLFTVVGETAPGREWLMENYFVDSLKELDERHKGPRTMIRPPIIRFADAAAERSFRRAVRVAQK